MKLPDSVRIGGVEYSVVTEPFLSDGGRELMGQIHFQHGIIALSENVEMSHETACLTLWHEIMHGIVNHFGLELEDEEQIVDTFARGVYQVLQDNGGRFFDLKEANE